MKKSFLSIPFLAAVLTLGSCSCSTTPEDKPITVEEQGLKYYLQGDGTYAVGVGDGLFLSKVTIPETYKDRKVTKIADYGFEEATYLTEIVLPKALEVGEGAFLGASNLTTITVGDKSLNTVFFNSTRKAALWNYEAPVGVDAFAGTNLMSYEFIDSHDTTIVEVKSYNGSVEKGISSIKLAAGLNEDATKVEATLDIFNGNGSQFVDFKDYGLFKDFKIKVVTEAGESEIDFAKGVALTADHYNFAHINATYPVLLFSLKLKEITNEGTIPTYISLERSGAYNWDKLMYGARGLPVVKREDLTSNVFMNFHNFRPAIKAYIAELHELNSSSTFSLYCVDNYCGLILEFFVANRIPETQWDATLLTDGSGTAAELCEVFAVDNPGAVLNELKANWANIKRDVYIAGESINLRDKYSYCDDPYYLFKYPYAILKAQPNVRYWAGRLRTGENLRDIAAKDAAFASQITSDISQFYTNSLLAALSEEDKAAFKNMYHFNDEMFSEATSQGKKAMVILGTSWGGEGENAERFYDYVRMTVEYYGKDEFVYYYKGHPGWPSSTCPDRKAVLTQLANDGYELIELDASVAAEVIMFYNPDIYLSGWQSTTFESVSDPAMACLMYGPKTASTSSYDDFMDGCIIRLPDSSTSYEHSCGASLALDATHRYYVLEFNNVDPGQQETYAKHEIAVYDGTAKALKYFKASGAAFIEVDKAGVEIA